MTVSVPVNQSRTLFPPYTTSILEVVQVVSTMYSNNYLFSPNESNSSSHIFWISTGIPMVYLSSVSAVIYRCGLIPSTTGKLKVMASYFLQIILIFIFLWLPGMILLALSRKPHDRSNIIYHFNTEYQSSLFLLA